MMMMMEGENLLFWRCFCYITSFFFAKENTQADTQAAAVTQQDIQLKLNFKRWGKDRAE